MPSADWGLRYQELSTNAGRGYARTLRRYQELLERVAKRELTPEQVQEQFQASLTTQSAEASRQLVELSVGLLAGMFYTEARYRDTLLDGLLPAEPPTPPPPSATGLELGTWFQALSTYASQQSARAAGRHQALIDRVASGVVSAATVREQSRRFVEVQSPAFMDDVMDLGLTFVERLQAASALMGESLYDSVLGPESGTQPTSSIAPEPPVTMTLRGALGSSVSGELVIENTRSVGVQVQCTVSELASRATGQRFRSGLEMLPATFTLAPGQQRDVVVQLPLDAALFEANADYVATAQVTGAGDRDLIVHLLIHTTVAPESVAISSRAKATPHAATSAKPRQATKPRRRRSR